MTGPRALAAHLRRYPGWYVLAAVWLVGMLALPVVHAVSPSDGSPTASGGAAAAPIPAPAGPGGPVIPFAWPATASPSAPGVGGDVVVPGAAAPGAAKPNPQPSSLVPPGVLDLVFDQLPVIVFPPLPDSLAPVAAALAPMASTGCSGLGLASVVVAVAAQSANGVPVQRILPYLAPLSSACASFPIAVHHTVCKADEPFVMDLGGVITTPPILGLGIDQLAATQELLTSAFGQPVPDVAAQLRTQLDCTIT